MHKGLLDREHLKTADGVEYSRDTLRPHFIKGAQVCSFRYFIKLPEQEEDHRDGQMIRQVLIALETL